MSVEYAAPESDQVIPSELGLHFGEHYWVPDINLTVYRLEKLMTDSYAADKARYRAIEFHEAFHRLTSNCGYLYNIMYRNYAAEHFMVKENPEVEKGVTMQLVNDLIRVQSVPLLEAFSTFLLNIQLQNAQVHGKWKAELTIKYLEATRNASLKNESIRKLYDKMNALWEWSGRSDIFVCNAVLFSLDIPCVINIGNVLARDPSCNTTIRFETLFDVIDTLNRKIPLTKRPFSSRLPYTRLVPNTYVSFEYRYWASLFYDYTGFQFGITSIHEEKIFRNLAKIQARPDGLFMQPINKKEEIEKFQNELDRRFGADIRKIFFDQHVVAIVTAFIVGKRYVYIPNYRYMSAETVMWWMMNYAGWLEMQYLIRNGDKDLLLQTLNEILPEDAFHEQKKKIEAAYRTIDYSNIDGTIAEDFKNISKQLGRKLKWN
ncbi:MAG: hypothetical protein HRF40_10585 [Nitrososphaera sp.]